MDYLSSNLWPVDDEVRAGPRLPICRVGGISVQLQDGQCTVILAVRQGVSLIAGESGAIIREGEE